MNDVQQFVVKSHSQSIEQQYQASSECWNLVVDEGLFQVYTRLVVLRGKWLCNHAVAGKY